MSDDIDSAWDQAQQDERAFFEHHRKLNDDYQAWLIELGILKPKRNDNEIRSESNG